MWKDVKGYEGYYEITETGQIRSKDRICVDSLGRRRFRKGEILKPDINACGYYRVTLAKDGKRKQRNLHRLIAEHFIPNPNNLPQINHKDGNKLNNDISNLEWVTVAENVIHAYEHGLINHVRGKEHPNYGKCGSASKKARKIIAINVLMGEAKEYGSIVETKADGFLPSEVSRVCNHGGTHHGHIFKFI